ncbi:hypothetical protein EDB89DRAFT_1912777 [Lactarius sanguifluus]|nr:hypothetical protein EDB89DRAFT_1912777 [Lactarius sanguifluus]
MSYSRYLILIEPDHSLIKIMSLVAMALTGARPQLDKVAMVMRKPFPLLTHLDVSMDDGNASVLPTKFLGGSAPCLQTIHFRNIPFPALPSLLLSASDLVKLELRSIPPTGYVSPEAMVASMAALPRLETFIVEFQSATSRPNQIHSPPLTRTVLPSLTYFEFQGASEYLEDLVARIDGPQLDQIVTVDLNQLVDIQVAQLSEFIDRSVGPKSNLSKIAHVAFFNTGAAFIVYSFASPNRRLIWRPVGRQGMVLTAQHNQVVHLNVQQVEARATTRPMRHRKMEREAVTLVVADSDSRSGCHNRTWSRYGLDTHPATQTEPNMWGKETECLTSIDRWRGILDPSFNVYETYGPQTWRRCGSLMNPKVNRWQFCSFATELSRFTKPQSMKNAEPQVVGTPAESAGVWIAVEPRERPSVIASHVTPHVPLMFYNADIYREEEEAAAAAAALCFIAILEARDARNERRRRRRRALRRGEPHPNPHGRTPRQMLRESQEDRGSGDDSDEEDDSVSTTDEASTSDDEFSLDDDDDDGDDDDDQPPPAERRAAPATTKKATFETSESSSDIDIANDPAVNGDDEDSEDDLVRAVPAKGKGKAVQAGKRKSLDNDDEDSDAHIRPVKKAKTAAQTTMTESFEKYPAGAELASKTTTVRTASGSTKPPPKNDYIKAVETSDDELLMALVTVDEALAKFPVEKMNRWALTLVVKDPFFVLNANINASRRYPDPSGKMWGLRTSRIMWALRRSHSRRNARPAASTQGADGSQSRHTGDLGVAHITGGGVGLYDPEVSTFFELAGGPSSFKTGAEPSPASGHATSSGLLQRSPFPLVS